MPVSLSATSGGSRRWRSGVVVRLEVVPHSTVAYVGSEEVVGTERDPLNFGRSASEPRGRRG